MNPKEDFVMKYFTFTPDGVENCRVTAMLQTGLVNEMRNDKTYPAIVICPGGGYGFVSEREAEPVGSPYFAAGYHVFILYYSVGVRAKDFEPLKQAAATIAHIRAHAKEWKVEPFAKITGVTTGKIVDFGIKDSMNMGAAMAPGACELIVRHFRDLNTTPKDYDLIVTGDLGEIGSEILCKLVGDYGYDISGNHEDCGVRMFDNKNQNTGSGGSGCGCSATVLSAYYLPMLKRGNYKKILFVPTGALLSPVSFNEGQSVPGIAHGVVFERSEN